MKNKVKSIIGYWVVLILFFLVSCTSEKKNEIEISIKPNEAVTLETSNIKIVYDTKMYPTVFMKKDGKLLSLNKTEKLDVESLPSFYIVTNKGIARNFELSFDKIKTENIVDEFGNGKKVILYGVSKEIDEVPLEVILTVSLHEEFPTVATMKAEFKNNSVNKSVELQEVYSNCYQLDASNVNSDNKPYDFYPFYGTDGRIFRQIESTLPATFKAINYTGRPDSLEGIKRGNGGIPVSDLWCAEGGIGVGHIEKKWKNLYFPMNVQENGKVFFGVKEVPNLNLLEPFVLAPNNSFKTVSTFLNVHSLDFYNTLKTYSDLMRKQGVNFTTKSTEDDYLPAWCSWNNYSTHAMASKVDVMVSKLIIDRLPDLKKMKVKEVIFDAGWFNNQGDWMPNTNELTFPNGEKDIVSTIKQIHDEGFKVKLWISYLTADPWSEVSKAHPEWMIKKTDGSFHLDRWSGYTMCPSLPEVQEFYRQMAERLVGKYGADGFKVDGMYVCPPCYNPEHHHKNPNESSEDFHKVFKSFYEGAKSLNSKAVIMNCPCGALCDYTSLPYVTETISADPITYLNVRRRAKVYRALKGASVPYSSDFIDVSVGNMKFPTMFANAVGVGAVPQSFYGKTPSDDVVEIYKKWFGIYSAEMISKAEYLNLYDIAFDKPETHAFRKNIDGKEVFYYSFFADESSWKGKVELRGLTSGKSYKVIDFVNNNELGAVTVSSPYIQITFDNYLFVKVLEK